MRSEGPESADLSADSAVTLDWSACLRGDIAAGFSLVLYAGGAVEEVATCAEGAGISAVYTLVNGEYVSYILAHRTS